MQRTDVPTKVTLTGMESWEAPCKGIVSMEYYSSSGGLGCNIIAFGRWNFFATTSTTPQHVTFFVNKDDEIIGNTGYVKAIILFTPMQ